MMPVVNYDIQGQVAIITLNSAPVNGLGHQLRAAILTSYENATNDASVKAIIIASSGKLFCGGADISEFGTEKMFIEPTLPTLLPLLEESKKPIVAAINGFALGGGLELCLACDYRIALPHASLGLPEVKLGLLPGAGGTQRLPRLIGVPKSLEMIVSGNPINAQAALELGLIDRIFKTDDFLTTAIEYANQLIVNNADVKSCADISVNTRDLPENFFADFRTSIARRTKGFFAPERCIQAVEASIELPLQEGLQKENELFQECVGTPQARAQQHLFFAERAAGRIPGLDPKTPLRDIKTVGIIGAGTMGGGIAMNFANAGIKVKLLEIKGDALERGLKAIHNNYEISAKRGKFTQEQMDKSISLINGTLSYDDFSDVDLVIEAVFENIDIKKSVFKQLDSVCKPGAILATNTSYLDVDAIAAVTKRPQDVIGLHFFSPANVMKLLEIVRATKTANDVLLTVLKTAQRIKKTPVVSGICWGFIGNRMFEPYGREATRLVLEGATPTQVDTALTQFGCAMGFLSVIDLAGIDVGFFAREGIREQLNHDPSYQVICDKLNNLGRFGQKTGRGFYIYEGRNRLEDPEVIELSKSTAKELNISQRSITDEEIVERTIYSMINEGARILEEGVSYRSSDIDLVFTNGYGFPAFRGGPMQYADEVGLDAVLKGIKKYQRELGEHGKNWFEPAPLLEKLAAQGKSFKDYQG
jgi:3-hydroxyacyl-CoA dehydrogenase